MTSAIASRVIALRLPLLELALLGWAAAHIVRTAFGGDFYEHLAVVGELAAQPLHPAHPQIDSNAPHAFYSPYAWLLGAATRVTGISPVHSLAAAAAVNLGLLIFGLRRFVALWTPDAQLASARFYVLLFALLLWGSEPWAMSGFLHIGVLGRVLPYPSLFATGLALVALRWQADAVRGQSGSRWLPGLGVTLAASVILLSHPLTFPLLVCGLGGVTLAFARNTWRETAMLIGIGFGSIALAAQWPLYSLVELLLAGTADFHSPNRELYESVLACTWPTLLGLPVLLLRLRRDRWDGLTLTGGGLALVYAGGWLTDAWSFGRVLSHLLLLTQVAMGVEAATVLDRIARGTASPDRFRLASTICVLLGVGALGMAGTLPMGLEGLSNRSVRDAIAPLAPHLGRGDRVLAELRFAGLPPALGARVVASNRPQPFIEQHDAMERAVARFFDPEATDTERRSILRSFEPSHLLMSTRDPVAVEALIASLHGSVHLLLRDEAYVLLEVRPVAAEPPRR